MIRRKLALLFAVLMVLELLTGCGRNSPGINADEDTSDSGREMVIGTPKVTSSFDFYNTTNGFENASMSQIYDTLVIRDNEGKIVPSLAEEYKASDDGMEYIFSLRKGVKFTNGVEFKASDAKYSIDQAISSSWTSWVYASVKDCEIVDEYTIKINMKEPNVSFLECLANCQYSAMLSEETVKKYGSQYGKSVEVTVGTGPYILKEWKPGELCVYEANPDYFKGSPAIKKARMKTITDVNAAIIALQTGEIHLYLNDIPGINYEAVSKSDNLCIVNFPGMVYFQCIMNNETGAFTDIRLRKAVAYALDRQQMLTVGAEGHGTIADYPGGPAHTGNPNIKSWHYNIDIEKSKELVKEAGAEGKSITIKTYATDPYPKLAIVLQNSLNKIGLNSEIQQMERGAFIDEVLSNGEFEIGICRNATQIKDMDEVMYGTLATASIAFTNWNWYSNPLMDEILTKAQRENDIEVRKELYAEAINIYTEEVPQIPLYFSEGSRAYSKDLIIDKDNVEYDRIFDYKWND